MRGAPIGDQGRVSSQSLRALISDRCPEGRLEFCRKSHAIFYRIPRVPQKLQAIFGGRKKEKSCMRSQLNCLQFLWDKGLFSFPRSPQIPKKSEGTAVLPIRVFISSAPAGQREKNLAFLSDSRPAARIS